MNCYRDGGLKRPFLHKAALLANIPDQGLSLPRPLTISTLGRYRIGYPRPGGSIRTRSGDICIPAACLYLFILAIIRNMAENENL